MDAPYQAAESDGHALVLLALHQELLAYGLDVEPAASTAACLTPLVMHQSAAGAFPPLRYVYRRGGRGRVITIRALAMFDDLIVNGTAITVVGAGASAEDCCVVHRRTTFDVSRWCHLLSLPTRDREQQGDEEEEEERERGLQQV